MTSKQHLRMLLSGVAALALLAQVASADPPYRHEHDVHGHPHPAVHVGPHGVPHLGPHPPGFTHLDVRYGHYHYYPPHGFFVNVLPVGFVTVRFGHAHFFFAGGVWYAARGPGFVVVAAPIGLLVPVLPPDYATVWIGGVPYYYADDTYYISTPNGYEVVAPPPGADDSAPPPDAPPPGPPPGEGGSSDVFVYPKNGQSEQQQATDKYECHKWAVSQSGFDPTVPGGGVPPELNAEKRSEYRRADVACLVGRGYSVN